MHNNLKNAGYTGLAYKQAMWKAACSTTEGEFRDRMNELKKLSEGAWEWFKDKPGAQWSKAFFSEKSKCDMLLNNVCESFNSAILDARGKAIITMLEWIREYLMKRLQKNRDKAKKWEGRLCSRICKILEQNMEQVADCIPIKSNDIYYQVSCIGGGQYSVNLQQWWCSCRIWQLTGIPCKHGICAILKQKLDPIDFVSDYYSVETYIKTYEHPIYPISYEALWGETLYIPPPPPTFGTRPKRGRRAKKRRLGADEEEEKKKKNNNGERMKRQQVTLHCRSCGEEGHNSKICKMFKKVQIGSKSDVGSGSGPPKTIVKKKVQVGSKNSVGSGSAPPKLSGKGDGPQSSKRTRTRSEIESNTNPGSIKIAPPKMRLIDEEDEGEISGGIATQQSQITTEIWLGPAPTPQFQGPTTHHQLQMGNPSLQTRVQIRAPPPSTYGGVFTNRNHITLQPETLRRVFVEGGHKFMSLSSQANEPDKNGKKKVGQ